MGSCALSQVGFELELQSPGCWDYGYKASLQFLKIFSYWNRYLYTVYNMIFWNENTLYISLKKTRWKAIKEDSQHWLPSCACAYTDIHPHASHPHEHVHMPHTHMHRHKICALLCTDMRANKLNCFCVYLGEGWDSLKCPSDSQVCNALLLVE